MSEPKLISPMLDDFIMGGVISSHDGVRSCPAMRKNSDDKYIVKIISVPASQSKLDALLLTGAYPDKAAALEYFKELADGIVVEKEILDRLSKLEGFVAYDDCQVVPMEDEVGFDVYLLGKYHSTLERYLSRNPMTHLGAVNLGLDLCAALAICRRSGYMCVDVKPSNIYITGDKEYCIGDLGFLRLNALKYESLPDKYRSAYTAPELEDAFAAISDTTDIYAVGMVLYQVFNGGVLPDTLDKPLMADDEMAQIILKACDPNPSNRWQDPVQMGQAIVSYMQKNGVNDTPLVIEEVEEATAELEADAQDISDTETGVIEEVSEEIAEDTDVDEIISAVENDVYEEPVEAFDTDDGETEAVTVAEIAESAVEILEAESEETSACAFEDVVEQPIEDETSETVLSETTDCESTAEEISVEDVITEEPDVDLDNLSFLDEVTGDIAADYNEISEDVSDILSQIDDLVTLEVPAPVVAPEPIEVKLPEPVIEESPEENAEEVTEVEVSDDEVINVSEAEDSVEEIPEEELTEEELPYTPKKKRTGLVWILILLILAGLAYGGYYFYQNYYLQPIESLELSGTEDRLEVQLSSDLDESLLTVVCSDPHGNSYPSAVVNGMAVFTGLAPDTAYTVAVEVDGFYQLTGVTSKVYSTPVQTKIAQMSVVTGSESGSVILSFTVEGPDSDQWNVIYNAPGEAERVTAFPSHMVTLTGLTVGKEYTFKLEPVESLYLSGDLETNYVVKELICAENLQITGCADGVLTAQWNAPANASVTQWIVRCYSDNGYDKTITTEETTATFGEITESSAFTVEVTAADMSVSKRAQVSANSVTISNFSVSAKNAQLKLKWKASTSIPSGGWLVRYSVDGVSAPAAIKTKENAATIPQIPNGNYSFTITDADGNVALGGPFSYQAKSASDFSAYSVKKADLTVRLCNTPSSPSWNYQDIDEKDYINTFPVGQKISMVISAAKNVKSSTDKVSITYVIYDEFGKLVDFSTESQVWQSMWYKNHCELDVPSVPAEVGTYELVLFLNGMNAGSQKFAITN